MAETITFEAGQSTKTPLTPNSVAICSATGDANNDTNLQFSTNGIPYWSPSVSASFTSTTNDRDRGNAVVTFKQGLTVEYISLSEDMYTVTVSGDIVDSGSTYQLQGKSLGTFPKSPAS